MVAKKKEPITGYCLAQVALLLSTLACCITLVVLQNKCLNAKKDDFVESYCMDDNRMRAVVSFVLSVLIFIIADSLSRAVKSFRTYKLINGINEGVFIAMASGFSYRLKAMKRKKWTIVIIAIVLVEIVPEFWQTISTYAITTENVFVRDQKSTVEIYNGYINYGGGVDNLKNLPNALLGGESLLPSVAALSTPQVSKIDRGKVITSVVRDALASNVSSSGSKNDLSFVYTDVVATVMTSCNTIRHENTMFPENADMQYIRKMDGSIGSAVGVTSSHTIVDKRSLFKVGKGFIYCQGQNSCNVTRATCVSDLSLARQKVIYVTNTRKVSPIEKIGDNTTISIQDFANIINPIISAPEQVASSFASVSSPIPSPGSGLGIIDGVVGAVTGVPLSGRKLLGLESLTGADGLTGIDASLNYIVDSVLLSSRSIGTGLFNNSFENELHARVCSAASISLLNLFSLSAISNASGEGIPDSLNSLYSGLQNIDLYTVIPQAYMPVYFAWILVAFFLTSVVILTTIDFFSFMMSPVNVKETNELALIDNIGHSMATERSNHELSNDTNEQESVSFEHKMYIKEEKTPSGERVVIEYSNIGTVPNKNTKYV